MLSDDEDRKMISGWMQGNLAAVEFCLQFFFVCHLWDDLIDKDVEREDAAINSAFWMAMVEIPSNPFYQRHIHTLQPIIANAIMEWHAANELQSSDLPDMEHHRHIAYTLRLSILSVITTCARIVGGYEWALNVTPEIRLYGQRETLNEYIEDLNNA